MRIVKLLVLSAIVVWARGADAVDSPHDGSFAGGPTEAECQSCHKLHSSAGGTLTTYSSNNSACVTCHASGSSTNNLFTGGWESTKSREAVPGASGDQHNWSALPTGSQAQLPQNPDMAAYLPSTTTALQCAVCHDVHGKRDATGSIQKTLAPNSAHSSYKVGTAVTDMNGLYAGTFKLNSIANADPKGYRIQVTAGGATGTFRYSTDYAMATALGRTPNWASASYINGEISMPGNANLKVQFASPGTGAEWEFYISYPFLRTANDLDQMCLDCHRDRNQTHDCVKGVTCTANGTTQFFSHPVGEALQTNDGTHTHDYDLAAPLDADGTAQYQANEANPSNALNLVNGKVSCTTCHAPHNADSNSLSVEVR